MNMPQSRALRVLLVEDEPLIAMDLEDALIEMGLIVLGPAGSVADALDLLQRDPDIDGAFLDMNLRGERATAVADALGALNIPFVVTSGYGRGALPEAHRERPFLVKPVKGADVEKAVRAHFKIKA